MKKTKGITKYVAEWQFVRVSVKGKSKDLKTLNESLSTVRKYFTAEPNLNRYERCVNWVEALIHGFKNSVDSVALIDRCCEELDLYGDGSSLELVDDFNEAVEYGFFKKLKEKDRLLIVKDLFNYEKHFCSRKYRSIELERLNNILHSVCEELGDVLGKRTMKELAVIRKNSVNGVNNKKFFF